MSQSNFPLVGAPSMPSLKPRINFNEVTKLLQDGSLIYLIDYTSNPPETDPPTKQKPAMVFQGYFPTNPRQERAERLQEAIDKIEKLGYKVESYRLSSPSQKDSFLAGYCAGKYDPEPETFYDTLVMFIFENEKAQS